MIEPLTSRAINGHLRASRYIALFFSRERPIAAPDADEP